MRNLTLPLLLIAATPLLGLACGSDPTTNGTTPTSTTTSTAPDGAPTGTTTATAPDGSSPLDDSGNPPGNPDAGATTPGTVGPAGVAAWDALSSSEKDKVKSFRTIFMHQSVGGDLEDGAEANGFKFEYSEASGTLTAGSRQGPFGALAGSNGDPGSKTRLMTSFVDRSSSALRVAVLKFGYADVVASTLANAKSLYMGMVTSIKSRGVRVVHVSPPFVFKVPGDNAPKMDMRSWMMATFPNDVVFDLEDIESVDPVTGARCERGGSWEICDNVRSTSTCSSKNQGIDAAMGQGHLCFKEAQRISKAFLYSIYQAGK
jgi:hypothetical protein